MNDPYQRLAIAIIRQAMLDLQAPDHEVRGRAITFLNNSPSLRSWCNLLDQDPASAIAAISKDIHVAGDGVLRSLSQDAKRRAS